MPRIHTSSTAVLLAAAQVIHLQNIADFRSADSPLTRQVAEANGI
jgi:hypothetical protein